MLLAVAESGCCAGHRCDQCATCQRGRCCRRDNPDYRLPADLGDWVEPIHGQLGSIATDGDRIECHVCGAWFKGLGAHLRVHDLTAREYKRLFGLRLDRDALVSERTRTSSKFRDAHAWLSDSNDPALPTGRGGARAPRHDVRAALGGGSADDEL